MGLEYKIEKTERKLLDKVVCDRCFAAVEKISEGGWNMWGEPYSVFHEPSFATFFLLRIHWGYGSRKDGETHQAVLCEDCYDTTFRDVRIAKTNDWRFEGANIDEFEIDANKPSDGQGS